MNSQIVDVQFTTPQAVVCLNGDLPPLPIMEKMAGIPLIAADGAARGLAGMGITPDVIIGDLDSLGGAAAAVDFPKSAVVHIADQDSTDFEKCLMSLLSAGRRSALICGVHGGEMEHTLNNWSVFMQFSRHMQLCLYDAGRYAIALRRSLRLAVEPGETISIIPQPKITLSTQGLHWPLSGESLEFGGRSGARNRATSAHVECIVHAGAALLFCAERLPLMPMLS